MITGDYHKINETLKNFSRDQNMRLFKTISESYGFYYSMVDNDLEVLHHTPCANTKNTNYWFKIDTQRKAGWHPLENKLIINIMGTRENSDPANPAITHSYDMEINYIQRPEEVQVWLNEYTNIVRELKLTTLIPTPNG
jgi:hypothetical protein